jgi:16S rRNA (cytidine1402-2'-O)-methyltransferase
VPDLMKGCLYIIPVLLGGEDISALLPEGTLNKIRPLRHFIVENSKSARHFLKLASISTSQQDLFITEIDKHSDNIPYDQFIKPALDGFDVGLLSEAGAPAVADPGAGFILAAHRAGIKVIPLTGPSSLLLALMASGLNGQSFCFHGYLPVNRDEKNQKLKQLEKDARLKNQTQLFIETPYRNNQLLKELIETLSPNIKLCIACNLTMADEYIKTQTIASWKKELPDLHKRPAVFLIL